jgi:hypothetical protein
MEIPNFGLPLTVLETSNAPGGGAKKLPTTKRDEVPKFTS